MAKVFRGTPGDPPKVTVEDGGAIRLLVSDSRFCWGNTSAEAADLAKALIADAIGDPNEASRLRIRFMHRVVAAWRSDQTWMITDAEVTGVVAEIRQVERDTAVMRRMVDQEPPPVVVDGNLPSIR